MFIRRRPCQPLTPVGGEVLKSQRMMDPICHTWILSYGHVIIHVTVYLMPWIAIMLWFFSSSFFSVFAPVCLPLHTPNKVAFLLRSARDRLWVVWVLVSLLLPLPVPLPTHLSAHWFVAILFLIPENIHLSLLSRDWPNFRFNADSELQACAWA